ncbi:hypothetical protein CYY_000267 [Polysphondylium violaceum]|uniref:Transmembrane protein n=1 Tax=Polysphondylium violaceum TaxID=133409 RepID=A0A8J4Q431_9MYCE|nr:hypothetical protein CYY_000267 [Polysphondylium violaceum]
MKLVSLFLLLCIIHNVFCQDGVKIDYYATLDCSGEVNYYSYFDSYHFEKNFQSNSTHIYYSGSEIYKFSVCYSGSDFSCMINKYDKTKGFEIHPDSSLLYYGAKSCSSELRVFYSRNNYCWPSGIFQLMNSTKTNLNDYICSDINCLNCTLRNTYPITDFCGFFEEDYVYPNIFLQAFHFSNNTLKGLWNSTISSKEEMKNTTIFADTSLQDSNTSSSSSKRKDSETSFGVEKQESSFQNENSVNLTIIDISDHFINLGNQIPQLKNIDSFEVSKGSISSCGSVLIILFLVIVLLF